MSFHGETHVILFQLEPFERGHIMGVQEASWSFRRIAVYVGCDTLVMLSYWQQWSNDYSYTYIPGFRWLHITDARQDPHIVRSLVTTSTS